MDSNRLEELLARYWNAETTEEEEQQLRHYFLNSDVPANLKETANLFRYYESQRKNTLQDAAFDHLLMANINTTKRSNIRKLVFNTMRIAAGIAVLVVAVWFVRNEVRKTTPEEIVDTYDDPKLAFEETKKALLMISKSFGKAKEQTKNINLFNKAQEEIKKKETKM